jgi:hypothetical protein
MSLTPQIGQRMMPITRRQAIVVGALSAYFAFALAVAVLSQFADIPKSDYLAVPPLSLIVQWGPRGVVYALACWLAWGDGHWLVRLATCLVVLVWTWVFWQASLNVAGHGDWGSYPLLHVPYMLLWPAGILAALRLVFGLHLAGDGEPLVRTPRQFRLIHVLLGISGIAAALGAIRLVSHPGLVGLGMWRDVEFHQSAALWITTDMLAAIPNATILVYGRGKWAAAIACFVLVVVAGTYVSLSVWSNPPGLRTLFFYSLMTGEQALVSLVVLLWFLAALRWAGYRLRWRRGAEAGQQVLAG